MTCYSPILYICYLICFSFSANIPSLSSPYTNNWALLVSTSRYWFNYRHFSNTLSVYRSVKRLGIPDSNIILMLADEIACNSRNHYTPHIYHEQSKNFDLFASDVEVDYKGYEVSVENFFRILTGRHHQYTPRSKSLLLNENSNLLMYISGHGGNGFLKFQDNEELLDVELHDTLVQMLRNRRFRHILFLVDSCQATTMFDSISVSGILSAGSSIIGEDSLSHNFDRNIGLHLMDKWTYFMLIYLENIQPLSNLTLMSMFDSFDPLLIQSTPQFKNADFDQELHKLSIPEFFGSQRHVHIQGFYHMICIEYNMNVRCSNLVTKQIDFNPRYHYHYADKYTLRKSYFISTTPHVFSYFLLGDVYLFFIMTLFLLDHFGHSLIDS